MTFAAKHFAAVGALIGAGLIVAFGGFVSPANTATAQPSRQGTVQLGNANLDSFTATLADGRQQLIVLDQQRRVVCVYHIDSTSGEISLKSVRNIAFDLQMTEFNGVRPLPQDIRALLENR